MPLTLPALRRFGLKALAAITAGAATADLACWGTGSTVPLVANLALVWMVPHHPAIASALVSGV